MWYELTNLRYVMQVTLFTALLNLPNATHAGVLDVNATHDADSVLMLRFCYEDKQLLPYYAGDNSDIPANPGATIEHLRLSAAKIGITLELIRLPWLRCLQQLQDNTVDALVAGYVPERAHFTMYPQRENGEPDPTKAINQMSLCLAHRFDNPLAEKIATPNVTFTLARPLGYRPIGLPDNTILVGAHSLTNALELVIEGRVDATTVLCQLNGIDAKERYLNLLPIQLMYPPIHKSDGYLMLSKQFYLRSPKLAEALWQTLPGTLDRARYLQYMQFPEM